MRKMKKMRCDLKDELQGAEKYAEKYIFYKNSKPEWAKMYHTMAMGELEHVDMLHTMYDESVKEMAYIPEEDLMEWEHCVKMAAEEIAMIKLLLSK